MWIYIYKEREVRGYMFPSTCFPSFITDWLPGLHSGWSNSLQSVFTTVDDVDEGGSQSSTLDGIEKMSESDHLG